MNRTRTQLRAATLLALACFANPDARAGPQEPIRLPAAMKGRPYAVAIPVGGGEGDLSWTSDGTLPPGLALAAGRIEGTPRERGTWEFRVTVSDAGGTTLGPARFLLEVTNAPVGPLQVRTEGEVHSCVSAPIRIPLLAEGGTAPVLWRRIDSGDADWLVVDGSAVRGTPPAPGRWRIGLEAEDASGQTARGDLTIVIAGLPSGLPLKLLTASLPTAYSAVPYEHRLGAEGGTPPYTWEERGLPDWAALQGDVLRGTPGSPTASRVTLTVIDAAGARAAGREMGIDTRLPPFVTPPTITAVDLPACVTGLGYECSIPVRGGVGPYRFTAVRIDSDLLVDEEGWVRGCPAIPGVRRFDVTAVDAIGNVASAALSLNVHDATAGGGGRKVYLVGIGGILVGVLGVLALRYGSKGLDALRRRPAQGTKKPNAP